MKGNLGFLIEFCPCSPESQLGISILGPILVWRSRAEVFGFFKDGTPQWIKVQLCTEVFLKNFTLFFVKRRFTCSTKVNLDTEVHFCLGSSGRGLKESQVGCLLPPAIKDFDHEAPWPNLQFTWSRSDSRAHQSREHGVAWCSVWFLLVCHQR